MAAALDLPAFSYAQWAARVISAAVQRGNSCIMGWICCGSGIGAERQHGGAVELLPVSLSLDLSFACLCPLTSSLFASPASLTPERKFF